MEWTAEAETRLKEIPFFVRPAARKKIEKFAQELGVTQITVEKMEQIGRVSVKHGFKPLALPL